MVGIGQRETAQTTTATATSGRTDTSRTACAADPTGTAATDQESTVTAISTQATGTTTTAGRSGGTAPTLAAEPAVGVTVRLAQRQAAVPPDTARATRCGTHVSVAAGAARGISGINHRGSGLATGTPISTRAAGAAGAAHCVPNTGIDD